MGDLLEFEPVPRPGQTGGRLHEEKQRAFIALLATTGSPHRAARATEMTPKGATMLREADGSDSFNAAWDRALAIAAKNGTLKISTAVADAAARNAQLTPPSRLRDFEPDYDQSGMSEDDKLQLIEGLFYKWLGKVEQERYRAAGRRGSRRRLLPAPGDLLRSDLRSHVQRGWARMPGRSCPAFAAAASISPASPPPP